MKYIWILAILLMGCELRIEVDHPITPLGHGGMGFQSRYPTNSGESIYRALSLGAKGTELDVQMTKDSVLVAFHDYDLSYKTNFNGSVQDYTWDQLKEAEYTELPYRTYNILKIQDLFEHLENRKDYIFMFDTKLAGLSHKYQETLVRQITFLIDCYDMTGNVHIESKKKDFHQLFQRMKPGYSQFIYGPDFEEAFEIAQELNLDGITMSTKNITLEQVQEAHNAGLLVAVWQCSSKEANQEAIDKGPDYIQADQLKSLLKLLQ